MTEPYSKTLRSLAQQSAASEGFEILEGIYLAVSGPSFETPAEIRAFRTLGATLVGMSTVPETIVARHMGIGVLGISCVTNLAAGLGSKPLSHDEVFESGRLVESRLSRLFERLLPKIAAHLIAEPEAGQPVSISAPRTLCSPALIEKYSFPTNSFGAFTKVSSADYHSYTSST